MLDATPTLQQDRRAVGIDVRVVDDLVHALPDADRRGKVIHGLHALQRQTHRLRITHVARDHLDPPGKVRRPVAGVAVDLGVEVVQHPDLVAVGEKFVGAVRADETAAPRDQGSFFCHVRV